FLVAGLIEYQNGTAVRTAVDETVNLALFIARHDHRRIADERALVVALVGNFQFHGDEVPVRAEENLFLLFLEQFGVGEDSVRNTRGIRLGPVHIDIGSEGLRHGLYSYSKEKGWVPVNYRKHTII